MVPPLAMEAVVALALSGPAQELVTRAGRGVVGDGAGIVGAVVYGNGSGIGGHGARVATGKVLVIDEGDVVLDDLPHGIELVGAFIRTGQGRLEGALVSNLGGRRTVRGGPTLEGIARAGEAAGRRAGGSAIDGCIRRRGGVGDGHGRAGATAIIIGNGKGDFLNDFGLLDNNTRRLLIHTERSEGSGGIAPSIKQFVSSAAVIPAVG